MNVDVHTLRQMTWYIAGACAVLTGLTFALAGSWMGFGALVGGLVAIGNWYGMRWLGERLLRANDRGKMVWGTLLAIKMGAILGVVWMILATGWVDPIGFAVGMSGFVLGILGGTLHLASSPAAPPAAEEN